MASEEDPEFQSFLAQAKAVGLKEPQEIAKYIHQCYDRKERVERFNKEREAERMRIESDNLKLETEERMQKEKLRHDKEMKERELNCSYQASMKAPLPKLKCFDEKKDDIDSFLYRFENHAKLNKWPEEIWISCLSSLLEGQALSLYHSLSSAGTISYEFFKESLLKKFQCTKEGFREKFRTVTPETDESFQSFRNRLKHYADR